MAVGFNDVEMNDEITESKVRRKNTAVNQMFM